MVISLDGYSGAGKITQLHLLADALGLKHREHLGVREDHRYEHALFAFHDCAPGFMYSHFDWRLNLLMTDLCGFCATMKNPRII